MTQQFNEYVHTLSSYEKIRYAESQSDPFGTCFGIYIGINRC